MAPGSSCFCHSPYRNFFPINYVEDELARDSSPAKGFYLGNISPALSCDPTPGLILVLFLISTPVPAPAPVFPFSDKLFRQFMKAYLESNQGPK